MAELNRYDVVIIGGGHNGLVCACYLAAAGLRVRVLERRGLVGGAATTEEFYPGFRNSAASYTVSLLNAKVIGDLRLREHGLRILERPLANFLPLSDSHYLKMGGGLAATQAEVTRHSRKDAERLPEYYRMLEAAADPIRALLLETPPNTGGGLADLLRLVKVAGRLKRLDIVAQRDLLALLARGAGEILDTWFESEPLKAALGFDSVVGTFASPYTPGTAYVLLHHVLGEVNGKKGAWGHAVGGMGAITQAMAKEGMRRGVEISVDTPVAKVLVQNRAARGVVLEDGSEIESRCVAANVDPKRLYLSLVDPSELDSEFLSRIRAYKCGSATFRMNVALSELPQFSCLQSKGPHHSSGIILAPSLAYMDRAYRAARESGWSREPVIEMLIPSTLDDSLAPKGAHVASLFCQHFNPELPDGRSWDEAREEAADLIIDTVNAYAPNFKAAVLARTILSPLDLERRFGLTRGDIFHGALTLDQLYSARPILGYGNYRGPLRGLYLCGSGAHPGGGVSGVPGHNAAREILRDFRWRRIPK